MVGVVDEDLGVGVRLESGTVGVVSKKNVVEVLGGDIFSRVVNLRLVVDIDAGDTLVCGLVEELSLEWVRSVVGNIVVSEMNDVLTGNTVLHHDLDGVMGVRLMTVVAVGVGSSHDDGPVGGLGSGGDGSESCGGHERFHCEGVCFCLKNYYKPLNQSTHI